MIIALSILPILYLLFLLWLRNGLSSTDTDISIEKHPTVSVIVAARNEEDSIGNLLENLLNQSYPQEQVEIIIVNDNSTDLTGDIIDRYAKKHSQIKHLLIQDTPPDWSPKKWALSRAIQDSSGDILLFTDADCTMTSNWITLMVSSFSDETIGIAAGPNLLRKDGGLMDQMLLHDSIGQDAFTAGTILRGLPLTCTGRNLAIRHTAFEDAGGYDGTETFISGDDDLLMHKIISSGWKVSFTIHTDAVIQSYPPSDFVEFIKQRLRFASKGKSYYTLPFTSNHLKTVLLFLFITNLSVLSGQISFLINQNIPALIPWIIKMVADWTLMKKYTYLISRQLNVFTLILTGIWHSLYVVIFGLLGPFVPISWKGRHSSPRISNHLNKQ
ncbi:MAG: glycosyltransferase [Candidatus Marinimicrobia bacterium]|nr:glycosyltransferase [Candidatus Neomarinimicrobiota bacterium]